MTNHSPDCCLVPQISTTENYNDPELSKWLSEVVGLEQNVVDKFLTEEYTLDDVLNQITRTDLKRLNLKGE